MTSAQLAHELLDEAAEIDDEFTSARAWVTDCAQVHATLAIGESLDQLARRLDRLAHSLERIQKTL